MRTQREINKVLRHGDLLAFSGVGIARWRGIAPVRLVGGVGFARVGLVAWP
jgi:hypothetical protein